MQLSLRQAEPIFNVETRTLNGAASQSRECLHYLLYTLKHVILRLRQVCGLTLTGEA